MFRTTVFFLKFVEIAWTFCFTRDATNIRYHSCSWAEEHLMILAINYLQK